MNQFPTVPRAKQATPDLAAGSVPTPGPAATPTTQETPMDWYCPECCASSNSGGTCAGCDVTLVQGDPDANS